MPRWWLLERLLGSRKSALESPSSDQVANALTRCLKALASIEEMLTSPTSSKPDPQETSSTSSSLVGATCQLDITFQLSGRDAIYTQSFSLSSNDFTWSLKPSNQILSSVAEAQRLGHSSEVVRLQNYVGLSIAHALERYFRHCILLQLSTTTQTDPSSSQT